MKNCPWLRTTGLSELEMGRHIWVGFLRRSVVKNLPANQEIRVCSLGREVPLEKEMATHSSILAWRIPWTEESGGLQLQRIRHDLATKQRQQMDTYR